jgi:DDE family transposase
MDECLTRHDALLLAAAKRLQGHQRRLFLAEVTLQLCDGNPRAAERRFGWGRDTVAKGLHELQHGIRCLENFAARARKRSEAKNPQLAQDIRDLVEPHTHADPELKSQRRYTNLSAAEVLRALKTQKGYAEQDLPKERTMRDILNRMNYRLKRVVKAKPLKKVPQTDAIFANVKAVQQQAKKDPATLEISIDTKAKVNEGDYGRGGKNADRLGRSDAQGVGSRPAGEAEVDPLGHPDGGEWGVDAGVRHSGDE